MSTTIPEGYLRIGYVLNARGPSKDREVTFAVKYTAGELGSTSPLPGTPDFYSQAVPYLTTRFGDISGAFANVSALVAIRFQWHEGSQLVPVTPNVNGSASGSLMPPEAAYIVRLYTATPGRKGRGRTFLPDVLEDAVDGDGYVTNTGPHELWGEFLLSLDNIVDPTASDFEHGLDGAHVLHSDGVTTPSRITYTAPAPRLGWLRRRGR